MPSSISSSSSIVDPLDPPPTFDICYMHAVSGGLQFTTLLGCSLIFYVFSFSKREVLWQILLVHAISGFAGTLIESAYSALGLCALSTSGLAWLLAVNEINWVLHEATTVYYSLIKTTVIFTSRPTLKKVLNYFMLTLFLLFAGLRANIGRLRYSFNTLQNEDIRHAHSYAFIVWGVADLIIVTLLVINVRDIVSKSYGSGGGRLVQTLLNSSIPRISIIFFNTLCIVVVGQIQNPNPTLKNFNSFLWLLKGGFPIILLLDILMTKSMLIAARSSGGDSEVSQLQTLGQGNHYSGNNINNNNSSNNNAYVQHHQYHPYGGSGVAAIHAGPYSPTSPGMGKAQMPSAYHAQYQNV
ncbi:hypothetical protein HDV05_000063 [Chytridiales sp. JEL 0842]|nr:hypothetical protein HDV05_000063 [Chytridiales sp. JEL 0842]